MTFVLTQNGSLGQSIFIKRQTIKEAGIKEEQVRDLIADNIENFFPDLKLISKEFSRWEKSGRSLDVLAIDKNCSLVVIELKRDEFAGHAELQALRYAAMASRCNLNSLIEAGCAHLKKAGKADEANKFKDALLDFLDLTCEEVDKALGENPQKIILISSSFSREVTTTVLWINDNFRIGDMTEDVITCIEVGVYDFQDRQCLYFDQIIPIPKADEYRVRLKEKSADVAKGLEKQKSEKTWKILEEAGKLIDGSEIFLLPLEKYKNIPIDQRIAYYRLSGKFEWLGNVLPSLNAVHKTMASSNNIDIGSIQAPDFWALKNSGNSLAKEAKALGN